MFDTENIKKKKTVLLHFAALVVFELLRNKNSIWMKLETFSSVISSLTETSLLWSSSSLCLWNRTKWRIWSINTQRKLSQSHVSHQVPLMTLFNGDCCSFSEESVSIPAESKISAGFTWFFPFFPFFFLFLSFFPLFLFLFLSFFFPLFLSFFLFSPCPVQHYGSRIEKGKKKKQSLVVVVWFSSSWCSNIFSSRQMWTGGRPAEHTHSVCMKPRCWKSCRMRSGIVLLE